MSRKFGKTKNTETQPKLSGSYKKSVFSMTVALGSSWNARLLSVTYRSAPLEKQMTLYDFEDNAFDLKVY